MQTHVTVTHQEELYLSFLGGHLCWLERLCQAGLFAKPSPTREEDGVLPVNVGGPALGHLHQRSSKVRTDVAIVAASGSGIPAFLAPTLKHQCKGAARCTQM